MASQQDIRRRIRSVQNTRKITRALELVAAAKLRRAQARIEDMRPYADRMLELMAGTARASASVRGLPLLQRRQNVQTVAVVTMMGDRGLSGPFNSQVLRRALALNRELRGEGKDVRWIGVGRRGVGSLRFRRFELAGEFTGFIDNPRYADAQAIAHRVAELYTEEEVDRVVRSEEHTSELQSPCNLVCRLLLEKKKNNIHRPLDRRPRGVSVVAVMPTHVYFLERDKLYVDLTHEALAVCSDPLHGIADVVSRRT